MANINHLILVGLFIHTTSIFAMESENNPKYRILDPLKSTDLFKVILKDQKSKFCVALKVYNGSNEPASLVAALYADMQRETHQIYSKKKHALLAALTETSYADLFALGKRHRIWLRPTYKNGEFVTPLTTDVIISKYNNGQDAELNPISCENWIQAIPGRDSNVVATIDGQGLVTIHYEKWVPDTPEQQFAKFLEPYAPSEEKMEKILAMMNHDN